MAISKVRSQILESKLEVRDLLLQVAGDTANLGTWTWEPTSGQWDCSVRGLALLGASAGEPATLDTLLGLICVEDLPQVRKAMNSAFQLRASFSVMFRTQPSDRIQRQLNLAGRAHASAVHHGHTAISGVLREVPDAQTLRLGRLATRLEALRKVEQRSLAHQLHSEVSHSLSHLRHELISLSRSRHLSPDVSAKLNGLAFEAAEGLKNVRRTIHELHPPGVEDLGFAGALERYASETAERAGLNLSLSLPKGHLPVEPAALTALFAVARAGIDNVVQHANARSFRVCVAMGLSELRLQIADDGTGLKQRDLQKPDAFGLLSATIQLATVGGRIKTAGIPAQGTIVEARVPLLGTKALPAPQA